MKRSSCLSQPPLSSVRLQPSVDPQKLHQRGTEGDVLQDVCPLAGMAQTTRALPKGNQLSLRLDEDGHAGAVSLGTTWGKAANEAQQESEQQADILS